METWQNTEGLIFWMWFIVFLFISLLLFIIFIARISFQHILQKEKEMNIAAMQHQKELLRTSIFSQEKERNRIAQDIHDGLISQLNIIRLTKQKSDKEFRKMMQDCMKTAREISHDLMPPFIEESKLVTLLENIVSKLKMTKGIEVHIKIHENKAVSVTTKLQLMRIVQEITTNITKHAKATKVVFVLRMTKENIYLKIEDNGIGFSNTKKKGLGFQSIATRIQLLKGTYKFKSNIQVGTVFLLQAPNN